MGLKRLRPRSRDSSILTALTNSDLSGLNSTLMQSSLPSSPSQATSFIKISQFKEFLSALGPPLGFDETYVNNRYMQEKFIATLDLPVYNHLEDYMFMDVLEALSFKVVVREQIKEERKVQEEISIQSEKEDEEQEEAKFQSKILQAFNQISYKENIQEFQALRELQKGEQRITNFKSHLQRDSHFTSLHLAAAKVVFNQLRYLVAKKKLLKKIDSAVEEAAEKQGNEKGGAVESKIGMKEENDQLRFQVIDGQNKVNRFSNSILTPRRQQADSFKSTRQKVREKVSNLNQQVDDVIEEEYKYQSQQEQKFINSELECNLALKIEISDSNHEVVQAKSTQKVPQSYEKKQKFFNRMGVPLNMANISLSARALPQAKNKIPIKNQRNERMDKLGTVNSNRNPIAQRSSNLIHKRKEINQKRELLQDHYDIDLEKLKREVEELLKPENSPLVLSPARRTQVLSNQQTSDTRKLESGFSSMIELDLKAKKEEIDEIESEIERILTRKETWKLVEKMQNGVEVSLIQLKQTVFSKEQLENFIIEEEDYFSKDENYFAQNE